VRGHRVGAADDDDAIGDHGALVGGEAGELGVDRAAQRDAIEVGAAVEIDARRLGRLADRVVEREEQREVRRERGQRRTGAAEVRSWARP
jgi:hypothetical protein